MNCHELQNLIDEYLDGELSAEQHAAADKHLAACQACRTELDALKHTVDSVRSLPKIAAPPGMAQHIKAELARQAAPRPRPATLRWAGLGGWLAAAAALILVIKYAPLDTQETPPLPTIQTPAPHPGPAVHKEAAKSAPAARKRRAALKSISVDAEKDKLAKGAILREQRALHEAADGGEQQNGMPHARPESNHVATGIRPAGGAYARKGGEADAHHHLTRAKKTDAAAPGAAPAPLADRSKTEAEAADKAQPRRLRSARLELVYQTKDLAVGLAEVRRTVAQLGTLVEKENGRREQGVVLAVLPGARIGELIQRLHLARPAENKLMAAADGAGLKAVRRPIAAQGVGTTGRGGAGAPRVDSPAVRVRILLRLTPVDKTTDKPD